MNESPRTDVFVERFLALPEGHHRGACDGRRYALTVARSADGRRHRLWAEELGGPDRVSLNLFLLCDGRALLKPCEMPEAKVIAFVLGYRPDA